MKKIAPLVLVCLFAGILPASYAEGSGKRVVSLDQKLAELDRALDQLKTSHQEIVSSQTAVKQELASLRVWIQKRR